MTLYKRQTYAKRKNRQTEPGLVAFYNIRPGNEAGLFLQPRSAAGHQQLEACTGLGLRLAGQPRD